jgi:hypothetical protein
MRRATIWILGLLLLGGCTSLTLNPVTPANSTAVGSITVEYDAALAGKKENVLNRLDMKNLMTQALRQSFQAGGDRSLRVTITQFRTGGYGPTRMHAKAEVLDAAGAVVMQTEADSTSAMGRLQAVAQEIVDQIVAGL